MMEAVRTLLLGVGEDPEREGLLKTPKRVAEAMRFSPVATTVFGRNCQRCHLR